MKRLTILALFIFTSLFVNAQIGVYNGKPHYIIQAIREGVPIGTIEVELYPSIAPKHVRNFDSLVSQNFYDTTAFHRVIPGFVIQGGDPNSRHGPRNTWGFGNASQVEIPAEFNPISHVRGVLSAARDNNINSANSQFFICHAAATSLDFNYTAYGKVVSGLAVVDNIVASPRDANDGPLQKIEMFVTRGTDDPTAVAGTPVIIQPADNFIGISPTYLFKWNAVPGALIYDLEFSEDSLFQNILVKKSTAALSISVSDLTEGKVKYYWRMFANNGGFKSVATSTRSFLTGVEAPSLVLPANSSTSSTTLTNFKWNAVSGAESYRIQVSTTPAFTTSAIKLDSTGILGDSFRYNFPLANRKYYWRVSSEVNHVSGTNSAAFSFTTGSLVGINVQEVSVSVFPNPSINEVTFCSNELTQQVELRVMDVLGKLVIFEKANTNNHSLKVNHKLTPGKYFYEIKNGDKLLKGNFQVAF